MIKDYGSSKSVIVIALQSGMSHSIIAIIMKSKNKVIKAVKGSVLLKATRLTKLLLKSLYQTWKNF